MLHRDIFLITDRQNARSCVIVIFGPSSLGPTTTQSFKLKHTYTDRTRTQDTVRKVLNECISFDERDVQCTEREIKRNYDLLLLGTRRRVAYVRGDSRKRPVTS